MRTGLPQRLTAFGPGFVSPFSRIHCTSDKFTKKQHSKGPFKVAEIILQIRQLLSASFTASVCFYHSFTHGLVGPQNILTTGLRAGDRAVNWELVT